MKFLCDRMLGTLAKWLRVYGFDTFYPKEGLKESDILDKCKKEDRILITRDQELIYNAKRELVKSIFIKSKDLDEQLCIVIDKKNPKNKQFLTRCLICNNILIDIAKKDIKRIVPKKIYGAYNDFLFCNNCKKVYWPGSHYKKMKGKKWN